MDESGSWRHVKTQLISALGNYFESAGANAIIGRLLAYILLTTEPTPLPKIAEELGISKAAASIHLRALRQMGFVLKTVSPGDRRDFYIIHPEFEGAFLRAEVDKIRELLLILNRTLNIMRGMERRGPEYQEAERRLLSFYQICDRIAEQIADIVHELGRPTGER